jgi:hypothetical protein
MDSIDNIRKFTSISKAKSAQKVDLEEIIDDALLESIVAELRSQSGMCKDEEGELDTNKNDVIGLSEQNNEDLTDLTKDKITRETNQAITTGFSSLNFFIETLKEPSKLQISKARHAVLT